MILLFLFFISIKSAGQGVYYGQLFLAVKKNHKNLIRKKHSANFDDKEELLSEPPNVYFIDFNSGENDEAKDQKNKMLKAEHNYLNFSDRDFLFDFNALEIPSKKNVLRASENLFYLIIGNESFSKTLPFAKSLVFDNQKKYMKLFKSYVKKFIFHQKMPKRKAKLDNFIKEIANHSKNLIYRISILMKYKPRNEVFLKLWKDTFNSIDLKVTKNGKKKIMQLFHPDKLNRLNEYIDAFMAEKIKMKERNRIDLLNREDDQNSHLHLGQHIGTIVFDSINDANTELLIQ